MTDLPNEAAVRKRLRDDFPHYANACLKIRAKDGEIVDFALNDAQRFVHQRAQLQLRERGYVRIILLKARQLGMSTYVEARFFWKVTHSVGVRAFILTHHSDATANLFSMAKRFEEAAPRQVVPLVGASSSRELAFPEMDAGYKVGTAGTEGIGRSDTIQLFHGSEVAFWPKAEEHAAGALQAVPKERGTEIWLESTANGMGGLYHEMCQDALRDIGEYELIFLPWYTDSRYRMKVPEDFELQTEEEEQQELYGVDDEQIYWRREKIRELRSHWLFKQEYPGSAEEAFQVSGGDNLINSEVVMRARNTEIKDASGPLIIGVDPSEGVGKDKTAIIRRKGRQAYGIETYLDYSPMDVAAKVSMIIDVEKPDRVFIDKGGIGAGIFDRLLEMGYSGKVVGVNFGSTAMNQERYKNLRAEMWDKMREWLEDIPIDIPDDNALHQDLCAPEYKHTSTRQIQLEAKEVMKKKRGLSSPDVGDALALTFAYPVRAKSGKKTDRYRRKEPRRGTWMSA